MMIYIVPYEINDYNNVTLDMGRSNKRKYFPGPRGPETFTTHKAGSSDNTLSGLSMESLLDLGMSLPSTMGCKSHEMPPNYGQIYSYEGSLLTGN